VLGSFSPLLDMPRPLKQSQDVALMGAFTSLSIIASLGQQLNTIINWNDIKIAQWQNVKDNVGSAELNITGASLGADLVLFYIRKHPCACPTAREQHG
jgi:hypothetical protein